MIIKTLVENTSISNSFGNEHGLSLYIETKEHKILFDVGASDLFYENAKKLNVDIATVNYAVISHGHDDHGGGLHTFLKMNEKAEVFMHRLAFEKHFAMRQNDKIEFIGLDETLKLHNQIVFVSDRFFINKGIQLFSNIVLREPRPVSNMGLLEDLGDKVIDDSFSHEINLIIEEDGKTLLLTGCAHNGIVNIVEHYHSIMGKMPDYVIGGFHLSSRSGGNADSSTIDKIAIHLLNTESKYFTCHCTGLEAFNQLKSTMGANINYLSTGSEIII